MALGDTCRVILLTFFIGALFIFVLSSKYIIHSNIIIENSDNIHNIHFVVLALFIMRIGLNFFLLSNFLPMRLR